MNGVAEILTGLIVILVIGGAAYAAGYVSGYEAGKHSYETRRVL